MSRSKPSESLDELRLIALSRIPRCKTCPRFHALDAVRERPSTVLGRLPVVPASCTHEVCAPMAARYPDRLVVGPRLRVAGLVHRVRSVEQDEPDRAAAVAV